MLHNCPTGGIRVGRWTETVCDARLLFVDLYVFHQRADQLPACRPIGVFNTVTDSAGKLLD